MERVFGLLAVDDIRLDAQRMYHTHVNRYQLHPHCGHSYLLAYSQLVIIEVAQVRPASILLPIWVAPSSLCLRM